MNYRLRQSWPLISGVVAATLILVLAFTDAIPRDRGITLTGLALIAGLASQLVLVNRDGIVRERRLISITTDLRVVTAELERLATIDPLTGLRNRRAFFAVLSAEFRRAQRYGRDLSVVMIDIDDFKRVNDEGGHVFGDYVLTATARTLAEQTRDSDVVARYGGEEFVIMLPETNEDGAAAVAEKLRRAIEGLEYRSGEFPPAGQPAYRVTISVGTASGPVEETQNETELVKCADRALYAAKSAGKNRVHRWTPTGSVEVTQPSA